jgi:hypothetical protein
MIAAGPQHVHLDAAEPGANDALTGVWVRHTIPTRRNRCIGDWSLRWNNGFAALFVALLALPAAGCSQECLTLCNVWFDYQRDMCGETEAEDERVGCISDYQSEQATEAEATQCAARAAELEALKDTSCCAETTSTCDSIVGADDDDSAPGS